METGKTESNLQVMQIWLKKSTMTKININKLTIVISKEGYTRFTMGEIAVLMQS